MQFLMSYLGPLYYFLGTEVPSCSKIIIQDLLTRVALTDERTVEAPMELNVHLPTTVVDPLSNLTLYQHFVGSLVYLTDTRPVEETNCSAPRSSAPLPAAPSLHFPTLPSTICSTALSSWPRRWQNH